MSYAASLALQRAVYQSLRSDKVLSDLIGDAVYDAMPVDPPSGPYVSLGPEEATDASDVSARGSRHDFVVSILTGTDESIGFRAVKEAAAAVSENLERGELELDHGHLAGLWFLRAKARRVEKGAARRVDMIFRARIDLG